MRALPKWPRLTVIGKPVTKEQAAEIIVRTSGLDFFTNDQEWDWFLNKTLGFGAVRSWDVGWEEREARREELGVLDIDYLANRRIASSSMGGPHGWCNWNGDIMAGNYNIGKWPSEEAVLEEWQKIAEAFPYLELSSQLWSGEVTEEHSEPIVQYEVAGGRAVQVEVGAPQRLPRPDIENEVIALLSSPLRERGCSSERFAWALEVTRRALGLPSSPSSP